MEYYAGDLETFESMLEAIYGILFAGAAIAELGAIGVVAMTFLVIFAVLVVIGIALYIFKAYAIYSFAKKLNYPRAWIAWIPIKYCRIFVLSDLAGEKRLEFWHGKFKHDDRKLGFWAYVGIDFAGPTIINMLCSIVMLIPVVGMPASCICYVLNLLPLLASAILEYIYFRDILELFKEDKHSNEVTSFVITIIDVLVGGGLARAIYLLTMKKLEPLNRIEYEQEIPNDQEVQYEQVIED